MNYHLIKISMGLILGATFAIVATAEPVSPAPKEAEQNEAQPKLEVNEKEIKLPGVTIIRATREIHIDAVVCLEEGLLEYVVCRPDTFEHESIFSTTAKPELVHAAFLVCGLKPTPQRRGISALWAKRALKQKDSRIKIEVAWEEKGVKKRVNLTSLLRDREEFEGNSTATPEKKPKEVSKVQDAWIFSGSYLYVHPKTKKEFYAANSSGILIGIWPNPSTVIQYGVASGNPYEAKHLGLEVNKELAPKMDTKVKLIFSQYKDPSEKVEPKK